MRIEKTYYAFDETEFDNEQDCLAYEEKIKKNMGGLRFYDEYFFPIVINGPDAAEKFGEAIYILVTDASEAGGFIDWLINYTGICAPTPEHWRTGDVWYYDEDRYEWVNLTGQIERINEILNVFKEKTNEHT